MASLPTSILIKIITVSYHFRQIQRFKVSHPISISRIKNVIRGDCQSYQNASSKKCVRFRAAQKKFRFTYLMQSECYFTAFSPCPNSIRPFAESFVLKHIYIYIIKSVYKWMTACLLRRNNFVTLEF